MRIKSVEISNYKSIKEESITLEGLTTFVGANGSGKSNFLKAIDFFYKPKDIANKNDFFNENTSEPISIKVVYTSLSNEELEHFNKYLSPNKELLVIKEVASPNTSGKYYGISMGYKEFVDIPRTPVADFRNRYKELQKQYTDLPNATTAVDMNEAFDAWEQQHPDKLVEIKSENQFFGFDNSSVHSLEKFTKFVYVPAVLNETHLSDARNTPMGDLVDILARKKLKEDEQIKKLQEEISRKFAEKLKPFNELEMSDLSTGVSKTLGSYYNDAKVNIRLNEENLEITLPTPKADIEIKEGNYTTTISSVGQGLQRAFILSLLQYIAENNVSEAKEEFNLILGIDEPELYQHPSKQKLFYKVLKSLSEKGSSVASSIQCCYTTHCPLMVNIENFNQIIRVSRASAIEGEPSSTNLQRSTLTKLAEEEAKLPSKGTASPELKVLSGMINAIDSRVNEGFFSNFVVLVEGESDVIALKMASKHHTKGSVDLDALDIPIISCNGINNLSKPAIIFNLLKIPSYIIWDSDYSEQEALDELVAKGTGTPEKIEGLKGSIKGITTRNKDLLSLINKEGEDWPSLISEKGACFKYNLEETLKLELGEGYLLGLINKHNININIKNAIKNPLIMSIVLDEAFSTGNKSKSLESIIDAIISLKDKQKGK